MTINEKIEIIKKMRDNTYACATSFKREGKMAQYDGFMQEAIAYDSVLFVLTDQQYAEDMKKIFIA